MTERSARANISVQATPACAFCEFLTQVPGAPDRGRYALLVHREAGYADSSQ